MNFYLNKYRFCERQISAPVKNDTSLILVIPCYNEPDVLKTLQSLSECDEPKCYAEVIVVINSGEQDDENVLAQNEKTVREAEAWIKNQRKGKLSFHFTDVKNLPKKHAGVGLARKIGMDEAVWRFDEIKNENGIIVCLDADCTVSKNYLSEIENHFAKHPKATGCSIYFEHPLQGTEFAPEIYEGIINYELFLRYYKLSLAFCGFPFPFHTIGSCMAVGNSIYQKQGGMNRRKAGEDFYFLHKVFPLRGFTELNSATVFPSPRQSSRVPFGTGSAITKFIASGNKEYLTYSFKTFEDLKFFFEKIPALFSASSHSLLSSLPTTIGEFLNQNYFEEKLQEIKENSSSQKQFVNRFYRWFDGFMVLKFVHFARDNFYAPVPVADTARKLFEKISFTGKADTKREMLEGLRGIERRSVPQWSSLTRNDY